MNYDYIELFIFVLLLFCFHTMSLAHFHIYWIIFLLNSLTQYES